MTLVEGLTEVRPVNAIPPVAGLAFGPVGALACGIGNVAADLVSGFGWPSVLGLIGNAAAAWLPYKLWHLFRNEPPNLRKISNILIYAAISLVNAFTTAWLLSFGLQAFFGTWIETIYTYVLYNNLGFSVMLGMPILIIITSDSVRLGLEPVPRGPLERFKKTRRIAAAAYTAIMAAICACILVFHMSPAGQPVLWALSGGAAIGLAALVV
jgi:energy-coupling factor transport system substrate-specific component